MTTTGHVATYDTGIKVEINLYFRNQIYIKIKHHDYTSNLYIRMELLKVIRINLYVTAFTNNFSSRYLFHLLLFVSK